MGTIHASQKRVVLAREYLGQYTRAVVSGPTDNVIFPTLAATKMFVLDVVLLRYEDQFAGGQGRVRHDSTCAGILICMCEIFFKITTCYVAFM